jgi:hypothetical protein
MAGAVVLVAPLQRNMPPSDDEGSVLKLKRILSLSL